MSVRRPIVVAVILLGGCARIGFGGAGLSGDGAGDRSSHDGRSSTDSLSERWIGEARSDARHEAGSPPSPIALKLGGGGYDYGHGVTATSKGFCITGSFEKTLAVGVQNVTSAGLADILLACFDSAGKPTWAKPLGGPYIDRGHAISADLEDNVYVVGYFTAAANLGGGTVSGQGGEEGFIASFTSAGVPRWFKTFGSVTGDRAHGVSVGPGSRACLIGEVGPGARFGDLLPGIGGLDVLVACLDSAGNLQSAKLLGSKANDIGRGIAVDGASNLYLTGSVGDYPVEGGISPLTYYGGSDVFVASLSSTGTVRFWHSSGGSGDDFGRALALDASGNLLVAGDFRGGAKFNASTALVAAAESDLFVLSYSGSGTPLWVKSFPGSGIDESWGIASGAGGNVFVTGGFSATVTFGPEARTSQGGEDVFVLSLTPAGGYRWSKTFGAAADDSGHAVAVSGGALVVTGHFSGTVDFGTGPLSGVLDDLFVLRLPQ